MNGGSRCVKRATSPRQRRKGKKDRKKLHRWHKMYMCVLINGYKQTHVQHASRLVKIIIHTVTDIRCVHIFFIFAFKTIILNVCLQKTTERVCIKLTLSNAVAARHRQIWVNVFLSHSFEHLSIRDRYTLLMICYWETLIDTRCFAISTTLTHNT